VNEHKSPKPTELKEPTAAAIVPVMSFWGENYKVAFLFISIAILFLGNGLIGTLLALRANLEGMGINTIGLMMSAYFVGYIGGAIAIPKLIQRVGHIRTFAALASIGSAISLAHVLEVSEISWMILRLAYGVCFAGMLLVAESWLNGAVTTKYRGRTLSIYSMVIMGAWALSQLSLNLASVEGFALFALVSIMLSFALVPITLTQQTYTGAIHSIEFKPRRLLLASPMGVFGAVASGLIAGALLGMGPVFAQSVSMDQTGVSAFMGLMMVGALVSQWPLGWLSDQMDRRLVIVGICVATAILGGLIVITAMGAESLLLGLTFLLGGALFPLYSISVAHLNDHIDYDEMIPAASGMIMLYGMGAAIGPFTASLFMSLFGPRGLFVYAALIALLFAAYGFYRLSTTEPVPETDREQYINIPRTTHIAPELHPQAEYEHDHGDEEPATS